MHENIQIPLTLTHLYVFLLVDSCIPYNHEGMPSVCGDSISLKVVDGLGKDISWQLEKSVLQF